MTLKLHNTLTKTTEEFKPQDANKVTLYTCGPTVYNYLTVGNWFGYIMWDVLVRTLRANDYTVERVMNITDVGHLVSDADDGEDKLEKGARLEEKTAWEIAQFYTDDFIEGMKKLNLITPEYLTKATEYIPQQLDLVRQLKEKGYTYQIDDGIYFDTSKFSTYADFADLDLAGQKAGARVEFNSKKRNPSDFALWKFTPLDEKRDMEWPTPEWLLEDGNENMTSAESKSANSQLPNSISKTMGFPGWHLECSSMAMTILGDTLDIHTGGIDHIPIHHTNEIAQSESSTGRQFARFWLHNNHLTVNGTKISKSLGNGYTLSDLAEKGYNALDYRMFALQSQYRNESNFSFDNLDAAHNRLHNWRNIAALRHQTHDTLNNQSKGDDTSLAAIWAIREALNNDLNTPEALRIIDEVFTHLESYDKEQVNRDALVSLLEAIDSTLGLQLLETTSDISDEYKQIILEREDSRDRKDWDESDRLRLKLLETGIVLKDTSKGTIWQYA